MKTMLTIFTASLAALGFAVLATARFYTDPQCFFIFYKSQLSAPVSGALLGGGLSDWNADMLGFFLRETPIAAWFVAYWLGFLVFAWLWKRYRRASLLTSLQQAGWLLLPMVLMVVPASFWSDLPGSGWWIHEAYHDGRGYYPLLHLFKPRYIAVLTLAWLLYWGWRYARHLPL